MITITKATPLPIELQHYTLFEKTRPRRAVGATVMPMHSAPIHSLPMWGKSLPPTIHLGRSGIEIYDWDRLQQETQEELGLPYLDRTHYYLGMVDSQNNVQGMIYAQYKGSHFYISLLKTAPWNRNKATESNMPALAGVGSTLIAHVCQVFLTKRFRDPCSEAIILTGTFSAAPFYRKIGFVEADIYFTLPTSRAIKLTRAVMTQDYQWWNHNRL